MRYGSSSSPPVVLRNVGMPCPRLKRTLACLPYEIRAAVISHHVEALSPLFSYRFPPPRSVVIQLCFSPHVRQDAG